MRPVDDLMLLFLRATDQAGSDRLLEQIIEEHARPLVTRIIRAKLRLTDDRADQNRTLQDSDDLVGEVVLQLVKRWSDLRSALDSNPPSDFASYVAVAAHNSFNNYLRRKYPERWRLKDKLRYILLNQEGLLLWQEHRGKWLCGFAVWRDQLIPSCPAGRVRELREDEERRLGQLYDADQRLPQLVTALFNLASRPIEFNDLVSIIASVLSSSGRYSPVVEEPESDVSILRELPDNRSNIASRLEQRLYLERLWDEICQLPLSQRRALLLNLRDRNGSDMTALIFHTHVATLGQIADALELTAEEFAQLSRELPMEDTVIAKHLGLTRQQVINLRNSARRRLARRMRNLENAAQTLTSPTSISQGSAD